MNLQSKIIDSSTLRNAIGTAPKVYPPELKFLEEIPVEEGFIVRNLIAGPVFAPRDVSFLAFFQDQNGAKYLTLLVTSNSLRGRIADDATELLHELYKPPRRASPWERLSYLFGHGKRQEQALARMTERGEINADTAAAMSNLHIPVLHEDDVFVAFPEDDFVTRGSSLFKAVKASGIGNVCKSIQPFRSGLPISFVDALLATCRQA